jgi:proline-specific peptidase
MIESFTTGDGRKLAYRRKGNGPVLVCHSGGPGLPSAVFGDLGGLANDFELVLLDPRGTGASDRPGDNAAYRLEDYVSDLEELREHFGLDEIDLLGHSHGGFVAMVYAAMHPRRLRKLVLVATAPRFAPEYYSAVEAAWDASGEPMFESARASRARRFSEGWQDDEELLAIMAHELPLSFFRPQRVEEVLVLLHGESANGDALRFFNNEIAPQFDLRSKLPEIQAPTLVITGEQDFFGALAATEIADEIPAATCVVLGRAGHFVWIEAPDRFREEVTRFLST